MNRLPVLPLLAVLLLAACSDDDSGNTSGSGGGQPSSTSTSSSASSSSNGSGGGQGGAGGEGGNGGQGGAVGEGGSGGQGGSLPESGVIGTIAAEGGSATTLVAGAAYKRPSTGKLSVILADWPIECSQISNLLFQSPEVAEWVRFEPPPDGGTTSASHNKKVFSSVSTDGTLTAELTGSFPEDVNTPGAVVSGSVIFRTSNGATIGDARFRLTHCDDIE